MQPAAILDIDGTLVDTNYQHAIAWHRAFRSQGLAVALWRIHRHIGMGGDRLVPALLGDDLDDDVVSAIMAVEKDAYAALIDEVETMRGARDLVVDLKRRGHAVVLASSAKQEEADRYLDLLDVRDLLDGWTTSADVDATKPEPDLVRSALDKAGGARPSWWGTRRGTVPRQRAQASGR